MKFVKNGVTAKRINIILNVLIFLFFFKLNKIKIIKNIGNLYALLKNRPVNKNQ